MDHAHGIRSKWPGNRRSRERRSLQGSEIVPLPKSGGAEAEREGPNPLPDRTGKEQRNRSRADLKEEALPPDNARVQRFAEPEFRSSPTLRSAELSVTPRERLRKNAL